MRRNGETAVFWLTTASAASSLISISVMEILLGAAVLGWLLLWVFKQPVPLRWPSYFLPLAAFITLTLLSMAFSPDPAAGEHQIAKVVLFPMGLLATAFVTSESRAKHAYKLLLGVAVVSAVTAIVQFAILESAFLRTGDIRDDPTLLKRITGPLGHWMTFSGVQLLAWCAAIPAITVLKRKWIGAITLISLAIVLSNTRGVWLAAAAGFAFVALALPRRIVVAVLLPVLVVGLLASPLIFRRIRMTFDTGLATNYSRVVYLTVGLQMIKDHPLLGVGPERVDDEFPRYYNGNLKNFYYGHLHNNFVQIGAERGLLCLAAFVWFLVELYRSLIAVLRRSDESAKWPVLGALAALTGFVVSGLNEYNFGDSEVLVLLLFLVSIPFGLASHVQEDPDSQPG
jgi:putative inorganic carbon (hco3(-)) transporter